MLHLQRRGLSPLEAVQVMGMGSWRLKGQQSFMSIKYAETHAEHAQCSV